MISDKEKFFWLKCIGIVYAISLIVFSFYTTTFFFGNHDFYYMRFGTNIGQGIWEGRITQFILHSFLFDGQILPILYSFISLAFYTLATVLLAKIWRLPQNYIIVVLFSLIIVLNPYILSHLYYTFISISIMLWHLFVVLGLYFSLSKNIWLSIMLWIIALLGYSPVINMIVTLIVASLIIDFLIGNLSYKELLKKYYPVCLCALASGLIYFIVFEILKSYDIVQSFMYNTQILSIKDILLKFLNNPIIGFKILLFPTPFCSNIFALTLQGIVVLYIIYAYKKQKMIIASILLYILLLAMLTSAYISPHNVFYMYRINLFSVPYVIALLFAVTMSCNIKFVKNFAYLCSVVLIFTFCNSNFATQKIWYLGNKQDEYKMDRIRNDLLPQIDFNKKYRLYSIGGLYGRKKFADIAEYRLNYLKLYSEYYSYGYYLQPFFDSSLFFTEKYNPIWGNLFILNVHPVVVLNNEFLDDEQKNYAESFSKQIPFDTSGIYNWLISPKKRSVYVDKEDIFIYLDENIEQYNVIMKYFNF